jgi:L-lactate dehydrogenase complex protein LldG
MTARDDILNRLRRQAREASHPSPWRSRRQFDDLAERFVEALTASKGEVHRVTSLEEALDRVDLVLHEIEAVSAVVDAAPPLTEVDLNGRWLQVNWRWAGQPDGNWSGDAPQPPGSSQLEELRAFCATADVGLSVAQAALAETGTVVVASGPGRSRLTSLLPPVHLVLVPAGRLTTDIFTWTADRPEKLPAAVTLISGPSKTADIEQTMAIGVHGPKRFIAVLYN